MERKRSVKRYGSRKFKKSFGEKCLDFWRNFIAFMFSNIGIIGLVVGYTIAGAFIFQAIEGQITEDNYLEMAILRNKTAERLWRLLEDRNILDEAHWRIKTNEELLNYTWLVAEAIKNGYDGNNIDETANKWRFPGAFLYSLTVITTIGYGNLSPKTPWGKIATILYAIAGMPLFLLYLSNIGNILARCFKWLYAKCCLCRWCPNVAKKREERRRKKELEYDAYKIEDIEQETSSNFQRRDAVAIPMDELNLHNLPIHGSDEENSEMTNETFEEAYDSQNVTVPVTICLAIMVGYVFGGALLFKEYEGWDYLDGSYFCFISLSTIGFGDIVPGEKSYYNTEQELKMGFIFCSMYLMLGMALIAMCFNLMQEEVINKFRKIIQRIKRICR